jgi:hypothetical protein
MSDGVEYKPMTLVEFIESCGGFKLQPWQRELVAAIERGEKLPLDPVTMRNPYREWKSRHAEYVAAIRARYNVEAQAPAVGGSPAATS